MWYCFIRIHFFGVPEPHMWSASVGSWASDRAACFRALWHSRHCSDTDDGRRSQLPGKRGVGTLRETKALGYTSTLRAGTCHDRCAPTLAFWGSWLTRSSIYTSSKHCNLIFKKVPTYSSSTCTYLPGISFRTALPLWGQTT